ncbi:MAG: L-histidine N(alpha)-methyltransferase [Bacteroidales bacterium]|nr:L-histidine N(alpha)-methyltransferase [Bacteroidales bacterium]
MEQQILLSDIAADTLRGLSANPKYLLSKYFYDDTGSSIFQDIMQMPEYYLTGCEFGIFTLHKQQIAESFHEGVPGFDLIELGSGDGLKTKILLQQLVSKAINFNFYPVDISLKANNELVESLQRELPFLHVEAKTGDYFHEIKKLNGYSGLRKVILFLGSNIGNFSDIEINLFLGQLSAVCHQGDKVFIGFDLKKSPDVIMKAYSDPHGHTRRFNLNHLSRLNRELKADFQLSNFEHHADYDPVSGFTKSFLISTKEQTVHIAALEQSFHFAKWEPIFMELSRKFDLGTIENLSEKHGFVVEKNYSDPWNYFVDSLWVRE